MYLIGPGVSREELLLLLVTILSQTLLALVSRHLVSFSFLTAWHLNLVFDSTLSELPLGAPNYFDPSPEKPEDELSLQLSSPSSVWPFLTSNSTLRIQDRSSERYQTAQRPFPTGWSVPRTYPSDTEL
jgi:hypothetical protein